MGLDCIRSAVGKPYMKRWPKGLDRLKTPSLLDVRSTGSVSLNGRSMQSLQNRKPAPDPARTPELAAEVVLLQACDGDIHEHELS